MGANPKDMGACGCGLIGERLVLLNMGLRGQTISQISSIENSMVHQMKTGWCDECHQSEWMCLETGMGRTCDGRTNNTADGAHVLARHRADVASGAATGAQPSP